MLRITCALAAQVTTIKLEGQFLSPWLGEVRAAVTVARAKGAVSLNLKDLSFVDLPGIELLRSLRKEGIGITGASAFIEALLAVHDHRV